MPKWIGNRFGSIVPIAPGVEAPSAIYNFFDQYYSKVDGGWVNPTGQQRLVVSLVIIQQLQVMFTEHTFLHHQTPLT